MQSKVISVGMVMLFLLSGVTAFTPPVKVKTIIVGDWDIFDPEILVDDIVEIRGNITIHPGGALTLRNVILYFNQSKDLEFGISVKGGGTLNILDGSKVSVLNQSLRGRFEVKNGGSFILSKSIIDRIGRDFTTGMRIRSSLTTIKDSTISNSSVGLDIQGVNVSISGMYFYGNIVSILAEGSRLTVTKSTLTKALIGVESKNSTVIIDQSKIEKCNYGIILNSTVFIIKSTNIVSNLYGVMSNNASLTDLTSVGISQNIMKGISISGSILNATSLTMSSNSVAVEMLNESSGEIRSSVLTSNMIDYSLLHSALHLTDSSFAEGKVSFTGESNLTVSWSLIVRVVNESASPVQGADVRITHSGLNYSCNLTSNSAGYTPATPLLSFYREPNRTGYIGYYTIEAEYQGSKNLTTLNITKTTLITLTLFSPPPQISVLSVEPQMRSAVVTWTKYTGPLFYSYSIFLSLVNGSIGNLVREVRNSNTTSIILTSLKPGTEYFITIRLLFTDGRFSYGPQKGFKTLSEFPGPHYHLGGIDISSGVLTLSDGTYFINGDIRIHGSALLRVSNATLVLNSTQPMKYNIWVFESGALQSENAMMTSRGRFGMEVNSSLSLRSTIVSNLSFSGLILRSNSSSILSTTFIDSDSTIRASGVSVTLVDTMFLNVSDGPHISSGFGYLSNVTVANATTALLVDNESYAVVKGSWFSECVDAILADNSTLALDFLGIASCKTGIYTINATGVIRNLNVSQTASSLTIIDSSITVFSSRIENSDTGISVHGGNLNLEHTDLVANRVGVYSSNARISLLGGKVSNHQSGILGIDPQLTVQETYFEENDESLNLDGGKATLSGITLKRVSPKTMKSDISVSASTFNINSATITSESDVIMAKNSTLDIRYVAISHARTCLILHESEVNISSSSCRDALLYGIQMTDSVLAGKDVSISDVMLTGISMHRSQARVYNSTIDAIKLHAELIDSAFVAVSSEVDTSRIVLIEESTFERRWFLSVSVQNSDNTPLENVTVDVIANQTFVGKFKTNSQGVVRWVEVPVKKMTRTGEFDGNPVCVSASIDNLTVWKNFTMVSNAYMPFIITPPPMRITITILEPTDTSVRLEWKPAGSGEFTKLDILYRMSNETNWTVKGPYLPPQTSILIKNLTPDTTYIFKARSYNREGKYTDSDEKYVTTLKPNHPPEVSILLVPVTIYEGEEFTVKVSVRDIDGDTLEYVRISISGSYLNMRQTDNTSYELNITLVRGEYHVFFEASDGKDVAVTETMKLTVVSRSESLNLDMVLTALCIVEGVIILLILISKKTFFRFFSKKGEKGLTENEESPSSKKTRPHTVERPLAKRYRIPEESCSVQKKDGEESNEPTEKTQTDGREAH